MKAIEENIHYRDTLKYCDDVLKKRILTNIWIKKAVKRFLDDLKRQKDDGFPYEYHPELAAEVIDFAELLKIPDITTANGQLELLPWMKFIYSNIWGWRHKDNPAKRRFRSGYVEVARKNSKTTSILFPFILWDFIETNSAEAYFVSKDKEQSAKSFKELLFIIKSDKELAAAISETVAAITLEHSRIAFFSSESTGIDSYKNSLSIIDEFHAYDNDKIVTAFRYGGRARLNSLTLIITSAGNDISGPCYAENERCKKILYGTNTDDTYFGAIWSYDEDDDWTDSKNFIKANPSLGVIITRDVLENDLNDAQSFPPHQPDFKSKTCGLWSSGTTSWIPINVWEKNKSLSVDDYDLIGAECCGGIDLSSVQDFTAYSLFFKLPDGRYTAKHRFYIPEWTVKERFRKENINIFAWIEAGIVTVIPGETVDYEWIFRDVGADARKYNIKEIAYDAWQSTFLINKLEDALPSIVYNNFKQGIREFAGPTKEFERAVRDGSIIDNNPVMGWMMGNVVIKPDVNGNYKPLKDGKSSTKRIDGVVTSIMAFSRLLATSTENNCSFDELMSSI